MIWKITAIAWGLLIAMSVRIVAESKIDNALAEEQFQSGLAYAEGNGVSRDDRKAVEFFSQASASGHAKAQHNLGTMYLEGRGVKKDEVMALAWFKKAAEQNLAPSQDAVGRMFMQGIGTKKNCRQAIQWFDRASDQGNVDAELHLAQIYFFGEGECTRDYAGAAKWATKAAAADKPAAQNMLGFLYQHGFGVEKDPAKAIEFYLKAANQGDVKAQANLGAMYASGEGVPRDLVQAYVWLTLGAPKGDPLQSFPLTQIKQGMKPAQIQEGERLMREFRAKHVAAPHP
jgi:TPR repeat protein